MLMGKVVDMMRADWEQDVGVMSSVMVQWQN